MTFSSNANFAHHLKYLVAYRIARVQAPRSHLDRILERMTKAIFNYWLDTLPIRRCAIAGGVIAVTCMLAFGTAEIFERRDTALADYSQATVHLGTAVAEQTGRALQAVDLVLQEVQQHLEPQGLALRSESGSLQNDIALHDFLVSRLSNLPQLAAVSLIGSDGKMVSTSRAWPTPSIDLSDRDFYKYFELDNDKGVFISDPMRAKVDGVSTIFLARRVNGLDGAFLGVVVGSVQLEYFQDFYRAISGSDGGAVTMLRRDGLLLIQYPQGEDLIGRPRNSDDKWNKAVRGGGGKFRSPAFGSSRARLISIDPLPLYPIVIEVSILEQTALRQWRSQTTTILVIALSSAACLTALVWLVLIQLDRFAYSETALRESQERLAEKSAVLEATLKNMDQGLLMLDADRKILVSNSRAGSILGLPVGFLEDRPHYFDVLARRWERNETGRTDEEVIEMLRSGGDLDRLHISERLLPSGRIVEARNVPFEGGRVVRTYTDITDRKDWENRIRHIAQHDELTGLANRSAFQDNLCDAVKFAKPDNSSFALLCLDLDRFKLVNDTRGHQFGDRVLAEAARRMRAVTRDIDLVARMGGDEFAILQPLNGHSDAGSLLARRLVDAVSQPYDIDGQQAVIGVSIGIAFYGQHGDAPDLLMRSADVALYRAKESGRNTYCCFEPAMDMRYQERFLIEHDLRDAIGLNQFELAYQPVYDIATEQLRTFEALLRWNHPTRGLISPSHFIPVAEMSGLIVPIGRWAIETACAEASAWSRLVQQSSATPLRVAVNLSPMQFREPNLPEMVAEILNRTGLQGTQLDLEVTEGLLLDDSHQVLQTIHALKQQGIRITLDDFGSAYASLSYLCRFPFDRIKIDRSFINKIEEDQQAQAVVEAILTLSRKLKVEVVAEGVETMAQLHMLQQLQCDHVQGFLTGRPLSSAAARALLIEPCNRMFTAIGRAAVTPAIGQSEDLGLLIEV